MGQTYIESFRGFPISNDCANPRVLAFSSTRSANLCMALARVDGSPSAHAGQAFSAASTAASTSFCPATCTEAIFCFVAGLTTSILFPLPSTNLQRMINQRIRVRRARAHLSSNKQAFFELDWHGGVSYGSYRWGLSVFLKSDLLIATLPTNVTIHMFDHARKEGPRHEVRLLWLPRIVPDSEVYFLKVSNS